jgi:hypothetical protein
LCESGYLYDHPYIFQNNGNILVELPAFKFLTDTTFYSARRTDETVRKAWGEELAAMPIENSYIALTISARGDFGSGRSPRTKIVGDWINRSKRTPSIHISRCDQLAADRKVAGGAVEPLIRAPAASP